jgi:hypothetical protein
MPNRYEREIEEILRNLDNSESKTTKGPRFGQRSRRSPRDYNRRPRGFPSLHLRPVDWFLVIAVVAALVGGGYAYASSSTHDGNLVTGILAIIGAICLLLVLITPLLSRPRRSNRYGEMKVTPLSRNPLSNLATRWHLFMLKMRYRRRRDH